MPLKPSEAIQCWCCEEYSRLSELLGVKITKDGEAVKANKDKEVGACPHCGETLTTANICG
jgi:hypothetical protein